VFSHALNTKAMILIIRGRRNEGSALLRHSLAVALEHDKPSAALRAYYNVADVVLSSWDRYEEAADIIREGLAYARRVGNRYWEWLFLSHSYPLYALGAWDEVLALRAELPHEDWTRARLAFGTALRAAVPIYVHRGRIDEAKQMASALADLERTADVQERAYYQLSRAQILLAEGNREDALRLTESAFAERDALGIEHDTVKEAFALALQAALELGQSDKVDELLRVVERLSPGLRPQFLDASVARFRARLAALEGNAAAADRLFKGAAGLFHELGMPFYLAVTRLEHAEWLATQGRSGDAQPLLAEARELFTQLEATPWLERVERAGLQRAPATAPLV
jgi:ATP/maltotriose-dependent transcriptional regulator MalT